MHVMQVHASASISVIISIPLRQDSQPSGLLFICDQCEPNSCYTGPHIGSLTPIRPRDCEMVIWSGGIRSDSYNNFDGNDHQSRY